MNTIITLIMASIMAIVFSAIFLAFRMVIVANIKNRWTMARVMWGIDFVLFTALFAAVWLKG